MPRSLDFKILSAAIIAYFIFFSVFTSLRHYNFQTQTWDMAAFVQTFWNTAHGKIMYNNLEQAKNHLGVHLSPFLFLLVPGYILFSSPYYLLIIQTIALALGALPLYLLAKRRLGPPFPLIIAIGYLLYPQLHWINTFDFHEIAFFVPLMIAALYFIDAKKWLWASIFLILAASVKEDAILITAFVGIYLLTLPSAKEKKIGAAIIILSLIYFLIAVKIIMPALGGGLFRLDRYGSFGSAPAEIIKNIITKPLLVAETIFNRQKLDYLVWLFVPAAFLPFFSIRSLILLLPGLAENMLTTYKSQFQSFYHYDSVIVPAIFFGSICGLQNLLTRWPRFKSKARIILIASFLAGSNPTPPVLFWRVGGRNSADRPGPIHWFTKNNKDRDSSFRFIYSDANSFTPNVVPPPPP